MACEKVYLMRKVNYAAVTFTSVIAFLIGGLWYSPVGFESAWMQAHGYAAADVERIISQLLPLGFLSTFLAYFISCLITAMLCRRLGLRTWQAGAILGVALWLGYAATIGLTTNLFSTSALTGWWIDAGFQLVFLVIAAAVLAAWPSPVTQ